MSGPLCGARWLESTEVFCQREPHTSGECFSKIQIIYENGIVGKAEITWKDFREERLERAPSI